MHSRTYAKKEWENHSFIQSHSSSKCKFFASMWCLKKPILVSFFFFFFYFSLPTFVFVLPAFSSFPRHTHTLSGYFPPLGKDRTARFKKYIALRNKDFVYGMIIRKITVKSSMAASLAARQLWQKSTKWVCIHTEIQYVFQSYQIQALQQNLDSISSFTINRTYIKERQYKNCWQRKNTYCLA